MGGGVSAKWQITEAVPYNTGNFHRIIETSRVSGSITMALLVSFFPLFYLLSLSLYVSISFSLSLSLTLPHSLFLSPYFYFSVYLSLCSSLAIHIFIYLTISFYIEFFWFRHKNKRINLSTKKTFKHASKHKNLALHTIFFIYSCQKEDIRSRA